MQKNKYGILMYKYTDNLGDDIQSYAASKFLPSIDYVIDREKISSFVPKEKEKIKVIMNGWFNHDKTEFLISPYIEPLFVSVHFTENDLFLKRGYTYLTDYAKEVLSQYKIGCRDETTLNVLKSLGYKDTYFSSCLTTTINPIGKKEEKDYIVAVDMNPKIVEHLRKITDYEIVETTHWLFLDNDISYDEKIKKIKEYEELSFDERKKMVKKHANLSYKERMNLVEKQLKLYQNAKMVITDRIHVGLPCLGLKTKVLLIYYDYNKDRIETFKKFLTNCTEEEFLNMTDKDLKKIKNKNTYEKYRNNLIETVNDFIKKQSSQDSLPAPELFKEINMKREKYIKKLYEEKIEELQERIKTLEKENKEQKHLSENFKKIKNSRTWKIIGKYYENKL